MPPRMPLPSSESVGRRSRSGLYVERHRRDDGRKVTKLCGCSAGGHDFRTLGGEGERGGTTDTLTGPGHECALTGQLPCRHKFSLP